MLNGLNMGIEEVGKIIKGPEFNFEIPKCSLTEYLIPRMKSQLKDKIIQVWCIGERFLFVSITLLDLYYLG